MCMQHRRGARTGCSIRRVAAGSGAAGMAGAMAITRRSVTCCRCSRESTMRAIIAARSIWTVRAPDRPDCVVRTSGYARRAPRSTASRMNRGNAGKGRPALARHRVALGAVDADDPARAVFEHAALFIGTADRRIERAAAPRDQCRRLATQAIIVEPAARAPLQQRAAGKTLAGRCLGDHLIDHAAGRARLILTQLMFAACCAGSLPYRL